MATFGELLHRLGPDSNVRGRQFERIAKWWLLNDPVYRTQLDNVWLWDEWPGRWGPDAGIDLVARTKGGDLWAVQAKAYAPTTTITKRDIDTFLSESARTQFAYRLLVATTNQIGRTALRTLEEGLPAGLKLASDLGKARVVWPDSPDDLRAPRPALKEPFPHNQEAIDAVIDGFEETDRGQLVMACGTGKTLVGLWVTERIEAQRTLVLLPSLSLLAQTLREWTANTRRPFAFLPVCSDESVRGADHLVSHTAELGMPVTTDPAVIAAFLRKRSQPSVVFATYQSSPRIAEAFGQGRVPGFDLVIADEAHRVAGRVSSDFATVLDADAIRSRRRLFMTATPRYFTGRVRQEARREEFEVASMDDEATFGPVFHQLGFGEAIGRGLLTDYQVVIVGIDDPTYRVYAEKGTYVTTDGKEVTDARTLASHIGLAKAMRKYDLSRTITFHSRVKRARDFAADFPSVVNWMPARHQPKGSLWTDHVSGEMPSGQRDVRLDRLRHLGDDERGLLSNARCLAEGVDVPTLDAVAFVDPRRSQVDIVQAVGRAIRKADDKKVGTIVLPVFVGNTDNPEEALDGSTYRPVWDVLRALRAHDEELAEQLDSIRRQMGPLSRAVHKVPGKIRFDLPISIGADFARALQTRLVEATTASWEVWFGVLEQFAEREGHANVPQKHIEDGLMLGQWATNQRLFNGRGTLSRERTAKLDAFDGWTWDPVGDMWREGLSRLTAYIHANGHGRVKYTYEEEGFRLGQWVANQRRAFRQGWLEPDQVAALQLLKDWSWEASVHDDAWEEGLRSLMAYVAREGHSRVPSKWVEDGYKLGRWVVKQRAAGNRNVLPDERRTQLMALPGWVWNTKEAQWDEGFSRLTEYVQRTGSSRVPTDHLEGKYRLGQWVGSQRQHFRTGELRGDRIARLQALPDWGFDLHSTRWEEGFAKLADFVERQGHARVPIGQTDDGFNLGSWVKVQRREFSRGTIEPDRQRRLESLPGWAWDVAEARWGAAIDALRSFVAREGHSRVKQKHVENGLKLGSWVNTRRLDYRAGRLDPARIEQLEALPGWTWDALSARTAQRNP